MSPPPAPAHADDHPPAGGGGKSKNGLIAVAVGFIAITGAYMVGMMFFGMGNEALATSMARAGQTLSMLGTNTAVFFTLNRNLIYLAVGLAAMTLLLILWKKLV